MEYLFFSYPILYFFVIVAGLINYHKIRNSFYLKLFLIFIAYSLATEIAGFIFGQILKSNSFFIYNTWNLINNYFYLFFFLGILKSALKKKLLKYLLGIYTVLTIIDISYFTNFIERSMDNNIIIGSIIIVVSVMVYLTELLQDDAILNLKESMFFWISLGVLLFNIGFIPVFVIAEFISYSGVFRIITLILNLLLTGCFITGFIVSKKEFNNL
ncbi:MAG: hypothetical protein PHW92_08005 [Lutibacter sp.]|nr:hypothetical protein [Lutibacter sp.]